MNNLLLETFPALDPRDNKIRFFQKPENYKLALTGQHPDHPGIRFERVTDVELAKRKTEHENRNKMLSRKKFIMHKFLQLMKVYIKSTPDQQKKIAPAIIKRYIVEKNKIDTKIYVSNAYTNYQKYLGISGADIIKIFANVGAKIPLKKVRPLPHKYFVKGAKKTNVAKSVEKTKKSSEK